MPLIGLDGYSSGGFAISTPSVETKSVEFNEMDQQIQSPECQRMVLPRQDESERRLPEVVVDVIGRIVALTRREFGGEVTIEHMCDPEVPQHSWVVFHCTTSAALQKIREKKFRWYDEVAKLVPGAVDEFRLCLVPQS